MAATPLPFSLLPFRPAAERHCPIRIVSVHQLDAAGQLMRMFGAQARVQVLFNRWN